EQVEEGAELAVERGPRFVSRGGEKLDHGLDAFGVDPAGRDCLDVGASTGGFTDVLPPRGPPPRIPLPPPSPPLPPPPPPPPAPAGRPRGARVRAGDPPRAGRAAVRAGAGGLRGVLHLRDEGAPACTAARSSGLGGRRAGQAPVRGRPRRGGQRRRRHLARD